MTLEEYWQRELDNLRETLDKIQNGEKARLKFKQKTLLFLLRYHGKYAQNIEHQFYYRKRTKSNEVINHEKVFKFGGPRSIEVLSKHIPSHTNYVQKVQNTPWLQEHRHIQSIIKSKEIDAFYIYLSLTLLFFGFFISFIVLFIILTSLASTLK